MCISIRNGGNFYIGTTPLLPAPYHVLVTRTSAKTAAPVNLCLLHSQLGRLWQPSCTGKPPKGIQTALALPKVPLCQLRGAGLLDINKLSDCFNLGVRKTRLAMDIQSGSSFLLKTVHTPCSSPPAKLLFEVNL